MTSDDVNYYELLDVTTDATTDQIKSAYRQLARTAHPDAGGNAGLFRLIQRAYDTLRDPARRAAYDAALVDGPTGKHYDANSTQPGASDAGEGYSSGRSAWDDYSAYADPGWGTETVFDPSTPSPPTRWQRWVRSRGGFIATVASTATSTALFILLAAMLIARPDVLRPEDARPDVLADLVSVWWATLIAALVYGFIVFSAILEGSPIEVLALPDLATLLGFLWWVGAYWSIATDHERDTFFWIAGIWVVYRVSVLTTTILINERR